MFLISILDKEPELGTMSVLKTRHYLTDGSFRPLCYARLAFVKDRGVMCDLMAFERDPFVSGAALTDDSCVAVSFDFEPDSSDVLTLVLNSRGECESYVGGKRSAYKPAVTTYAGEDEQGWYWGVRFFISEEFIASLGVSPIFENGRVFNGNIYKFRRAGADEHFGAVAPVSDDCIFSKSNLCAMQAVTY